MKIFWVIAGSILATVLKGQAPQICLSAYQAIKPSYQNIGERRDSDVVSIQCVFHILYAQNGDNLSEEQILSQLVAINRDFSGVPQLASPVSSYYTSVIGSANIRFCLATVDPNGQKTNGITRTQTFAKFGSTNIKNAAAALSGGKDPWPADRYLNIWVAPFLDNVLGYSSGVAIGQFHDGVFLNTNVVGTIGALDPNYSLGHTLSHEIGHYLGLNHIWGAEPCSCSDDDGIADTPLQECYNYSCENLQKSCGQFPMHSNLMDYTFDACRGFFTKGQVQVMRSVLAEFRKGLTAASCSEPAIWSNQTLTYNDLVLGYSGERPFAYKIYDLSGKLLLNGISQGDYLRVDTAHFPAGIYLLSKKSTEQQSLEKIVICR